MSTSVVIKGNQYGIIVLLDNDMPFQQLKRIVASKFKEASHFFKKANMAITFEGRQLTLLEEKELIDIISENSSIQVICLLDNDKENEQHYKETLKDRLNALTNSYGQFYKGNLISGQVLESEKSIVVIGDVLTGAKIISSGNVIIIGTLKGTVYAGVTGDESSYIAALDMDPLQIRIGDILAKSSRKRMNQYDTDTQAKIAFVEDDYICMETLYTDLLE